MGSSLQWNWSYVVLDKEFLVSNGFLGCDFSLKCWSCNLTWWEVLELIQANRGLEEAGSEEWVDYQALRVI